jgi:hypothetical protein
MPGMEGGEPHGESKEKLAHPWEQTKDLTALARTVGPSVNTLQTLQESAADERPRALLFEGPKPSEPLFRTKLGAASEHPDESTEHPKEFDANLGAGGESRGGREDFGVTEARRDLREAQSEITVIIRELDGLGAGERAVVAEVSGDLAALDRLLTAVAELLAAGQAVPAGLAVSVMVRAELAQEAAKDAADHAAGELKSVLERVLTRLGRVGRKLLSMNLHLLPVKEWSLGGEVSALFVKGSINVTFGE